jgi:hypothetical protein
MMNNNIEIIKVLNLEVVIEKKERSWSDEFQS